MEKMYLLIIFSNQRKIFIEIWNGIDLKQFSI